MTRRRRADNIRMIGNRSKRFKRDIMRGKPIFANTRMCG